MISRFAAIPLLAAALTSPLFAQVGPFDIALSTAPTTANTGIQLVDYNTGIARTVTGITNDLDGNYTVALDGNNIPNLWSNVIRPSAGFQGTLDFYTLNGDAIAVNTHLNMGLGFGRPVRMHMFQGYLYLTAITGNGGNPVALYRRFNGTGNTVQVTPFTNPSDIGAVGDNIYVVVNSGTELWQVHIANTPPFVTKTQMVFNAPAGSTNPSGISAICAVGPQDFATQLALVDSLGKLYFFTPGAAGVNLTVPQQGVAGVVAIANHPDPSKGMVIATSTQVFEQANFTNPIGPAIYTSPTTITDMATDQGNIKFTGQGCNGSNGKAPTLTYPGAPVQGNPNFQLDLVDCPASVKARMMLGLSNTSYSFPPVALPLDLGIIGAPGCSLDVGILLEFNFFTNGLGELHLPLTLPVDPANHGLTLYVQFALFDPAANAVGLTTSNLMTMINR